LSKLKNRQSLIWANCYQLARRDLPLELGEEHPIIIRFACKIQHLEAPNLVLHPIGFTLTDDVAIIAVSSYLAFSSLPEIYKNQAVIFCGTFP